jgi:hypothetical protein
LEKVRGDYWIKCKDAGEIERGLERVREDYWRKSEVAGENCVLRSSMICTLHQMLNGQIKEYEIGEECGTNQKCVNGFCGRA